MAKQSIITCYFNRFTDPQRGVKWEASHEPLEKLVKSLNGENLIILTDCLPAKPKHWKNVTQINYEIKYNPYFSRWVAYYDYLTKNNIDEVFLVDATDVEMLKNPFPLKENTIYVGEEKDTISSKWLADKHPYFKDIFKDSKLRLLNVGVIGGRSEILIPLLFDFKMFLIMYGDRLGETDMAVFNFLLHTKYKDVIKYGDEITTHFNKFEKNNKVSLWKHK